MLDREARFCAFDGAVVDSFGFACLFDRFGGVPVAVVWQERVDDLAGVCDLAVFLTYDVVA